MVAHGICQRLCVISGCRSGFFGFLGLCHGHQHLGLEFCCSIVASQLPDINVLGVTILAGVSARSLVAWPIIAGQRDWSWAEELPAHPAAISITHAKALEVEVVKIRTSAGSSHVPRIRSIGGCRCCSRCVRVRRHPALLQCSDLDDLYFKSFCM